MARRYYTALLLVLLCLQAYSQTETQNPVFPFWKVNGNSGTTAGTNFIGTTDAVDWVVKTNNNERLRILANGYVGINTNSPVAQLSLIGSASFGSINNHITGSSSFAVGSNDTITSLGSIAVGDKVTATANACAIFGKESSVNGYGSLVSGRYANASGNHSVAFGYIDSALADGAFVANKNNTVRGNHATAFGTFNYAPSYGEFTIGNYSTIYTASSSSSINSSDRVFTIGIGTGAGSRADAIVVLKNGNTGIGTNAPARKLHIAGTGSGVRVESVATGGSFITTPAASTDKLLYADANGDVRAIANGTSGQVLTITGGVPAWGTGGTTGWELTGNSGTTAGTNFIGTTDAQAFDIRTNNILRTRITTKGAIEQHNTGQSVFVGQGAGQNDDLSNNNNAFVGYEAGRSNTTGGALVAVGYRALQSNTTAVNNTAVGYQSLGATTSGSSNTGVGFWSLLGNTTGIQNTAVGVDAMRFNTTGSNNAALGLYALRSGTTGSYNVAVGVESLTANTGSNNTALGFSSGSTNTGSGNIFIGKDAGSADVTGSNLLYIDNSNTATPLIYGNMATNSVTINDSLTSKYFKMTNGATNGYVLQGDAAGNGKWIDPATLSTGSWNVTGNSGTTAGTNFIGTTDAVDWVVKTNNSERMRILSDGNVGLGTASPNEQLEITANFRLPATTATAGIVYAGANRFIHTYGAGNSFFSGTNAGNLTNTAQANTGVGADALKLVTTGGFNTAIGRWTLSDNTTGMNNSAVGYGALLHNITNSDNTAMGASALNNNTGNNNTAIGSQAMIANTSGANNAALGYGALSVNTSGGSNVAVGRNAGNTNTTGNNNTLVGNDADVATANLSNATAIGAGATVAQSNALILGNNADVGIGTGTPARKLHIAGTGSGVRVESVATGGSFISTPAASTDKLLYADANGDIRAIANGSSGQVLTITGGIPAWGTATSNAWNLTGNSGTTPGTNFIGTTDAQVLIFKVNNNNAGYLGYGTTANTALGFNALGASNTGTANTAFGVNALGSNTTGSNNVAMGAGALINNKTANGNVALGYTALNQNISGGVNIGIGSQALYENTTGSRNIAIGYQAMNTNRSGSENLAIGYNADVADTALTNAIAIGPNSVVNQSNTMVLGNNVNVGIGTSAPSRKLHIAGTGSGVRVESVATGGSFITTPAASTDKLLYADANGDIRAIANGSSGQVLTITGGVPGWDITGWQLSGNAGTTAGTDFIGTTDAVDMVIKTNNTERMRVRSNGNIGINTTNPTQALLVVNGSQNNNISYGYLNSSGSVGTGSGTNAYSIYASARIAATEFNAYSDSRIKHITGITNNQNDLETLTALQITNYRYIDSIEKGNREVKKVIAQQVEQVYPQAVSKMTDVIPDIYQLAEAKHGYIQLPTTLRKGDMVKLVLSDRNSLFEVTAANPNGFTVDTAVSGKVFVYGRQVNDFRTVDYEALTTLNISATQQLVKMVNRLENENTTLKTRIDNLDANMENVIRILGVNDKATR